MGTATTTTAVGVQRVLYVARTRSAWSCSCRRPCCGRVVNATAPIFLVATCAATAAAPIAFPPSAPHSDARAHPTRHAGRYSVFAFDVVRRVIHRLGTGEGWKRRVWPSLIVGRPQWHEPHDLSDPRVHPRHVGAVSRARRPIRGAARQVRSSNARIREALPMAGQRCSLRRIWSRP